MENITLKNGIKMPAAGFGVFQIPTQEETARVVFDAISVGYRLIDTAQSYNNEEGVGDGIAQVINAGLVSRKDLFITTKVWLNAAGYEPALEALNESLKKLKLDYLDLVLIHQPYGDYYGTYRAMEQLQKEGKIRALGVSNFYPDRLVDIELNTTAGPVVNQIEVNPFNQQHEAQKWNEKYGVQLEAWAPFAEGKNGLFTNPVLSKIAEEHNKSVGQVVLRWLVQRSIIPLAKSTHIERMKENIDIFDFELTEKNMADITTLDTKKSQFFDHREAASVEYIKNLH